MFLELCLASNFCTFYFKENVLLFSLENMGRKYVLLYDVLHPIKAARLEYAPQSSFYPMSHQGWTGSPGEERGHWKKEERSSHGFINGQFQICLH